MVASNRSCRQEFRLITFGANQIPSFDLAHEQYIMSTICCNPLFLLVLVAITLAITHGFSSAGSPRRSPMATAMNVATEANDFASAMPEEVDPHVTIGVDPDDLAIGINPSEFLEWIGT